MAKRKLELVGEVCLYGAMPYGYGWLARYFDPPDYWAMLGDGELSPYRSATSAVWLAVEAIVAARKEAGMDGDGEIWVYASGGKSRAKTSLFWPGYFGDLKWEPAPVYVLAIEDIVAAAEKAEKTA